MSRRITLAPVGFALAAVLTFPFAARAEFFGVPLSDTLFTFEIEAPGYENCLRASEAKPTDSQGDLGGSLSAGRKRCPQVSTREGTFFQVQDTTKGYWYGFITVQKGEGKVTVTQVDLSYDRKIGHTVKGYGKAATAKIGGPEIDLGVKIRFLGQSVGSFPNSPPYTEPIDQNDKEQAAFLELTYGDPTESVCCIGCGPIRICGDVVNVQGCGSCGGGGRFPNV